MNYLVITILLNVIVFSLFKLFPKYLVNNLQAIVVNYWVCVVTGSIFMGHFPVSGVTVHAPWWPMAMLMGLGFILVFNLIGLCTRADGITTTTIANKLSLVIPVVFSIVLYHESAGGVKLLGIALAIPAVFLTTGSSKEGKKAQNYLLPALLFIGSGLLDTLINYAQLRYLGGQEVQAVFAVCSFGVAACIGSVALGALVVTGKMTLHYRNLVAGILLGVPNYFSIYFYIRYLNSHFLQSSAAIPVSNIGILVASAVTAMALFREKPTLWRIAGLSLAVIAIVLIAAGDR